MVKQATDIAFGPKGRIVWLVLLGLTILGVLVWEEVLEDRLVAKRWGVVEPDVIYRSGQMSQYVVADQLRENDIQVVVDLNGREEDCDDQNAELAAIERLGIELHRFNLRGDGTGHVERYVSALEQLHEANRNNERILVHCAAGSQRTGGTVAFYRILVQGWEPDAVLAEMKRYDHDPDDNPHLMRYLNRNMRYVARRLVQLGIIEYVPEPLPQFVYDDHIPRANTQQH